MQLEAWFDGEALDGAVPADFSGHVTSCPACFRHLETLSRLRVAIHRVGGAPLAPDLSAPERISALAPLPGRERKWSRALVAVPAALALLAAAAVGVSQVRLHDRLSADRSVGGNAPSSSSSGGTGASSSGARSGGVSGASPSSTQARNASTGSASAVSGSPSGASKGTGPTGLAGPLTLAVIVPTQGTAAAEGVEVTDAVRQAVAEANHSGGVGGAAVQLTVVPAEDSAAVAGLAGTVTAVVGGFGNAPASSVPWLLPADPWVSGVSVVASELTPAEAGARLGQDLLRRGATGVVGVVVGSGPDTALETGLAQEVRVAPVSAPSTGACLPALTALEAQGVEAVAIAGSPTLAASCASAFGSLAWAPPDGILVAPSAAYGGVTSAGVVPGTSVYTVLGLPWPESSNPGAARFRSEVPGASSYRALVSFAAVELAVQVARSTGSLSLAKIASGSWQSDLYDFAGTANVGAQVVQQSAGSWVSAP
jgi:hypothetical protein